MVPDGRFGLYLARIGLVAVAYFGAAKLGLSLAFETPSVTAVWPPTGIALAAVVLWGYRMWPGVALGAFAANLGTGIPLYATLGITCGNTLEALVGGFLLLGLAGFRPSLERVRDVVALAVLAAGVSTLVSATIGVATLLAAGEIEGGELWSVWRTWWLGDAGGDLVVAPVILIAATHWPFNRAPGGAVEAALAALAVLGTALLVFTQEQSITYLVFPALVWAVLRFWQPGAAAASLLVAAVAVPLTDGGSGPFMGATPDDRLLLAQSFVGVTGLGMLVLAAVITERQRAESAVREIAETLQRSLLPADLPSIPGVEVVADFRPAGGKNIMGGDFYDVFAHEDGSWGVVVGDVCGKGALAAARTGLVRNTLRAAALRQRQPSQVLRVVNEAIIRQAPREFCTVVYGRLGRDGSGSLTMTIANGGHPPALVLRATGAVEEVGHNGALLGVVDEPHLSDEAVTLAPGDALVLHTDGLTDAHAPRRIMTTAALSAALAGSTGGSAAGIVAAIERAAFEPAIGEPRDDVAVLVLRVVPDAERA